MLEVATWLAAAVLVAVPLHLLAYAGRLERALDAHGVARPPSPVGQWWRRVTGR